MRSMRDSRPAWPSILPAGNQRFSNGVNGPFLAAIPREPIEPSIGGASHVRRDLHAGGGTMRRRVAGLGTMMLALSLAVPAVGSAQAQAFPTKPVRIIAPFGAGGAVGFLITFIAQKLEAKWGERVLIDPRPGAAGN